MTLQSSDLKTGFLAMGLFYSEEEACAGWALVYREYFEAAIAGTVPVIAAALDGPEATMAAAMAGLSTAGPASIQAGVSAFWLALTPAATYFPAATGITPPAGVTGLASALSGVFAANIAGSKSAGESYEAISAAIHLASAGGIAIFPPPPGGIGPQTIV